MVRVVGLLAVIAPVLGSRVSLHEETKTAVARGVELLSQLKQTPTNVDLQNEYRTLIGDVEWSESRVFLETGAQIQQDPVALGATSSAGDVLVMAERTGSAFGRLLTGRRDYVFEQEGGESKYVLDGRTMSLHSRMFVSTAGDSNPRFILRRAFSYLNPIATVFGQYVYRVIQCSDAHEGECSEGDILYTITKDRIGQGYMAARDEYRVYTGTGGCSRSSYGTVGCEQASQIMYSLGAPIESATFDTDFYRGNIVAIDGFGPWNTMTHGVLYDANFHGIRENQREIGADEIDSMKVAHTTKTEGPPRWLNWIWPIVPIVGAGLEVVRAAIWTDSYRLTFDGATDELLVSLIVAAQDLTRDMINRRNTAAIVGGAAATGNVGVSVSFSVGGSAGTASGAAAAGGAAASR